MVVISDTSVISNLVQLDLAELLNELFGVVIIPKSVEEELSIIPSQLDYIRKKNWIKVSSISNKELYNELLENLDSGEAESIVLAIEMKADLLLIDEKKGRQIATSYGVKISGLIGLLIKAKEQLLVNEIKPILDKLVYEIGFRINPKLYSYILEIVDEA